MRGKGSKRKHEHFATGVGRALRRAAKDAQKVARMYGTPLYVWENGKVVAKKPQAPRLSRKGDPVVDDVETIEVRSPLFPD